MRRGVMIVGCALAACTSGSEPGASALTPGSASAPPSDPASATVLPDTLTVASATGPLTIALTPHLDLFAPGYVELRATGRPGAPPALVARPAVDTIATRGCLYQGRVTDARGADRGLMSVSLCAVPGGGTIVGGGILDGTLHELTASAPGLRAAMALAPLEMPTFIDRVHDVGLDLSGPPLAAAAGAAERVVEIVIVNDRFRTAILGSSAEANAATILSIVDTFYEETAFNERIDVVLTGQVSFEDTDPWVAARNASDEVDPFDLLDEFLTWMNAEPLPPHDHAQLLSGDAFSGTTIGLAPVGGMCSDRFSGSLVMTGSYPGNDGFDAIVSAHELGHSLSMEHDSDGNACAASGSIMGAVACAGCSSQDFSPCSIEYADSFLGSSQSSCLLETAGTTWNGPTCGDGIVEGPEACDCGGSDCSVVDPCCDGATCQLADGAVCAANDPCCDETCGVAAQGVTCRTEANADCDMPEVCDGVSAACPADLVEPSGTVCVDNSGNDGACFGGDCVSRSTQCVDLSPLYVPDFIVAPGCENRDLGAPLACTRSLCSDGARCYALSDSPPLDGTVCDTGRQCLDGTCVVSSALDAVFDQCPDDPAKTTPGVCGCGTPDTDTDGDSVLDCLDACPNDGSKDDPGACGCGTPDTDGDSDGVPDCLDACPADPAKTTPGVCGCGVSDATAVGASNPFAACYAAAIAAANGGGSPSTCTCP